MLAAVLYVASRPFIMGILGRDGGEKGQRGGKSGKEIEN